MTTTRPSTDQWLYKIDCAVRWRRCTASADSELDSSRFCFSFRALYLHLLYSRENDCIRRQASDIQMVTIRETTMTVLEEDRRPHDARLAVPWTQSAMEATELECSRFCFSFTVLYSQLPQFRKYQVLQNIIQKLLRLRAMAMTKA